MRRGNSGARDGVEREPALPVEDGATAGRRVLAHHVAGPYRVASAPSSARRRGSCCRRAAGSARRTGARPARPGTRGSRPGWPPTSARPSGATRAYGRPAERHGAQISDDRALRVAAPGECVKREPGRRRPAPCGRGPTTPACRDRSRAGGGTAAGQPDAATPTVATAPASARAARATAAPGRARASISRPGDPCRARAAAPASRRPSNPWRRAQGRRPRARSRPATRNASRGRSVGGERQNSQAEHRRSARSPAESAGVATAAAMASVTGRQGRTSGPR